MSSLTLMYIKDQNRCFGNVVARRGRRHGLDIWRLALILAIAAPPIASGAQDKNNEAVPAMSEQQLFARVQDIPGQLAKGQLSTNQIPNPHWRQDTCNACHTGQPARGNTRLREKDINRGCNYCHDAVSPHSYIHPVDMSLTQDMSRRMPKSYRDTIRLSDGKLSCATCHDLPAQCLPQRAAERQRNPLFLRDGPFHDRTQLCYRCHDEQAYARINPHKQVDEHGQRLDATCLICHRQVPEAGKPESVDFSTDGDLKDLCTGCHRWIPHPGGTFIFWGRTEPPNHLVTPSAVTANRMRQQGRARDMTLPLDPNTGKVYCGTCHNVHAPGVLSGAAARGAGAKQRLRSPEMCKVCHEK
jgi:hypothetical protein